MTHVLSSWRYSHVFWVLIMVAAMVGLFLSSQSALAAIDVTGGGSDTWISQNTQVVTLDPMSVGCAQDADVPGAFWILLGGDEGLKYRAGATLTFDYVGDWNGASGQQTYVTPSAATSYSISGGVPTCKKGDRLIISGLIVLYDGVTTQDASANPGARAVGGNTYSTGEVHADTQSPVLSGAEYKDTDFDGTVDAVALTFDESVSYDTFIDVDWSVVGNDIPNLKITGVSGVSGSTVTLNATADANVTGAKSLAGTSPQISLNTASITDDHGNGNEIFSLYPVRDKAMPAFYDGILVDQDDDGKFDAATLLFTEYVNYDSLITSAISWAITSSDDFDLPGFTISSVQSTAATPNYVWLEFPESNNQFTGVGDLALTFHGSSIKDISTNENIMTAAVLTAPGQPFSSFPVLREDTKPRLLSVSPVDNATLVDTAGSISLTFSEPMSSADMFSVPSAFTLNESSWSTDKQTITWTYSGMAENTTYDVTVDGGTAEGGWTPANKQVTAVNGLPLEFSFTTGENALTITNKSLSINSGAGTTNDQTVTLTIGATNATQMQVINGTDFSGAAWISYATEKSWALPGSTGNKTICVRFKNDTEESGSVCSTIVYDPDFGSSSGEQDPPATPAQPSDPGSTAPGSQANPFTSVAQLNQGDLIKLPNDNDPDTQLDTAVYYFGADGKRYAFPNPKVYATWHTDFSAVKVVTTDVLASVTLGGNMLVRPGTYFIKSPSLADVYAVTPGGVLRAFENEAAAIALYGANWGARLIDMPDGFMVNYIFGGDPLTTSSLLPEGAIVKHTSGGSATNYYVKSGALHEFTGSAFADNGFIASFLLGIDSATKQQYSSSSSISAKTDAYSKFIKKNKKTGAVSQL